MYRLSSLLALTLPVALAVAGCEIMPEDEPDRCAPAEPGEIDPLGAHYQYVVDAVDLPSTPAEAQAFGLNLDGDANERPDNALGQILASVFSNIDVDVDDRVQTGIDEARILHLIDVQAIALDDAEGVGVRIQLGNDLDDDPSDNFTGDEPFAVDPAHLSEPLTGYIEEGRLHVDLGIAPLRIALPHVDQTFVLHLEDARIEATITEDSITGILAGVMTEPEVQDGLLTVVHQSISASVKLDCLNGVCFPDSHGGYFLALFDDNADGEIELEELRQNTLIRALLAPDIDLFDRDGAIAPRCDGDKDSLSVGVAFSAVPATFR